LPLLAYSMVNDQCVALNMKRRILGSDLFMVSLCLLFMTSCAWKKGNVMDAAGPVVSRAVVVNRTVLEPAWDIVAGSSRSVVASQELWGSSALPTPTESTRAPAIREGESAVLNWLPPGETETMQRFVHNLHGGKGALAFILSRARQYLPVILDALEKYDLPRELAFLPLVESRFEIQAVSSAGAAGLWQIMPDTALRFGLNITESDDERFDVRKSTYAAAAYLAALHKRFKDWPLALAAYNCGEGAMSRALKQTGAGTLSELIAICRLEESTSVVLARETLEYVPKFVGAVQVMSSLVNIAEGRPGSGDASDGTCDGLLPRNAVTRICHENEVALQGGVP